MKKRPRDAAILVLLLFCAPLILSRIVLKFPTHFDEGISLYDAVRILHGQVPYRDFFHNTTPGAASLLALAFSIAGISMLTARLVIVFCDLVLMVLFYFLGKKLVRDPFLAVIPPVFFFLLDVFPNADYTTHRLGVFFALISLASAALMRGKIGLVLAGACGGASFLMNQNIGAWALVGTGILAAAKQWFFHDRLRLRRAAKHIASAVLGALLVVLPVLSVLAAHGTLGDFVYDTVIWPMTWYRSFNRYPYFSSEVTAIKEGIRQIADGFLAPVNFGEVGLYVFAGFLPLIVYPAALAASFFRRDWIVFSLSVMGLGLLLSSSNHPDYIHVIRTLLPLYPLAVLICASLRKEVVWGRRLALVPFAAVVCISALTFLDGVLFVMSPMGGPTFPVHTPRGTLYAATEIEAGVNEEVIRHIVSTTAQGDPVFIYHWSPELYFLSGRDNPTMFDTYKPLYTSPAQLEALRRQLQRSRPRLIVKDNYIASFSDPRGRTHATFPFVDPRRLIAEDPVDRWISGTYRLTRTVNIYRFLEPLHPSSR